MASLLGCGEELGTLDERVRLDVTVPLIFDIPFDCPNATQISTSVETAVILAGGFPLCETSRDSDKAVGTCADVC